MNTQKNTPTIKHEPDIQQFSLQIDDLSAELLYHLNGDIITFTHTGVPPELEGRGIGSQLARAGLEYARTKTLKVLPACSFIAGYIERHPEYQDLLAS